PKPSAGRSSGSPTRPVAWSGHPEGQGTPISVGPRTAGPLSATLVQPMVEPKRSSAGPSAGGEGALGAGASTPTASATEVYPAARTSRARPLWIRRGHNGPP